MHDYLSLDPNSKEVTVIKELWPESCFSKEFVLCYENHIPNVAVLLISGELVVESKHKQQAFKECGVFGVKALTQLLTLKERFTIKENSMVCAFDRVSFLEQMTVYPELKNLLEAA